MLLVKLSKKRIFFSIFILLIGTFLFIKQTKSNSFLEDSSYKQFKRFNEIMYEIDSNLNSNNLRNACLFSIEAKKSIESNIISFKKIQPNYSWNDIKDLLIELPIQLCEM